MTRVRPEMAKELYGIAWELDKISPEAAQMVYSALRIVVAIPVKSVCGHDSSCHERGTCMTATDEGVCGASVPDPEKEPSSFQWHCPSCTCRGDKVAR